MAFISKGRIIYLQTDLPIHFVPANSTFAWRLQPVHVINQPLRLPAAGMTILLQSQFHWNDDFIACMTLLPVCI